MKRIGRGRKAGFKCSEETKEKMSISKLGIPRTQETKDKIGKGMKKCWKDLKVAAGVLSPTNNKTLNEVIKELEEKKKNNN